MKTGKNHQYNRVVNKAMPNPQMNNLPIVSFKSIGFFAPIAFPVSASPANANPSAKYEKKKKLSTYQPETRLKLDQNYKHLHYRVVFML